MPLEPTEVIFRLSPSYGLHTARGVHDRFLEMMREHEEFEVETDKAGGVSGASRRMRVRIDGA